MVKTHGFPVDFSLNQSNEPASPRHGACHGAGRPSPALLQAGRRRRVGAAALDAEREDHALGAQVPQGPGAGARPGGHGYIVV